MRSHGRTPFVGVDKGEHRFNLGSARHAGFLFAALKSLGHFVVPAPFAHELVPNINLILGWLASHAETPMQNLFVGATLFHPFVKLIVIHAQEGHAKLVEAFA